MKKNVAVIGAGFSGLSAATTLADAGFQVTIYEKNDSSGGRARKFEVDGFSFDMGPSWYWMPDVFERYFKRFNKSVTDYYDLVRLDPSYKVVFSENDSWDIPASMSELQALFDKVEPGSGAKLAAFLKEAAYKYDVGINSLVYKPGLSLTEFADTRLMRGVVRLQVFNSISDHIRSYFSDSRLIQLLEFPVLFLGAMPSETPALYSLMNYADMSLGTWYPMGGMHKIVHGMETLAREKGVHFIFNADIEGLQIEKNKVTSLRVNGQDKHHDIVVASADYHHVEQQLLPPAYRRYTPAYWESRKMAPSSLIYYLGIDSKVPNLLHHNLFFDSDFTQHATEIYKNPSWPSKPLYYVCCSSKTDNEVAPKGMENMFILIPVAPGLEDSEEIREKYYHQTMDRLEKYTGMAIREHVVYKRSYAHSDFISDYYAFKGNAYGLANTLKQTAILKPSMINKKVRNLYYTGQLTVPGPGVPPSLISGQVVADQIEKQYVL
jgi:phytoene desaturase